MTLAKARYILTAASLGLTAANYVFFLLAPALGYPLTFDQSWQIAQLSLPVLLGYLGAATQFVFRTPSPGTGRSPKPAALVKLLVVAPIAIFVLIVSCALIAFGVSNSSTAPPGTGMNMDLLSAAITGALGFLAATTSGVVAYLFAAEAKA